MRPAVAWSLGGQGPEGRSGAKFLICWSVSLRHHFLRDVLRLTQAAIRVDPGPRPMRVRFRSASAALGGGSAEGCVVAIGSSPMLL